MDPEFFHADGKLKSADERQAYRNARQQAKQTAQYAAKEAAEAAKVPESPHVGRIAELKQERKFATRQRKSQIDHRLAMLEPEVQRWEADRKAEAQRVAFDRSDLARLAMESVERIQRSGKVIYPASDQKDLDSLLALAEQRHQFPDPDSFGREFFNLLARVEENESAVAAQQAADKRHEAAKLESESAFDALRAAEAKARQANIPGA